MMKRILGIIVAGVMIFSLQVSIFAEREPLLEETAAQEQTVQPRGAFFWQGTMSITPHDGYVTVKGNSKCYESVGEVGVTLIVYQQQSNGAWLEVWRDTYKGYNCRSVDSPYVDVNTGSGTFKLVGYHYAIKNGVTESNDSETNAVNAW